MIMKRQLLIFTLYCCFNTFGQDIGYDNLFKLIEEKKIEDVTEFLHSPEGKDNMRWALKYMECFEFPSEILVKTAMKLTFPNGRSTKKEDVVIDNKLIRMIIYYDDGKDVLTDSERMQLAHAIISNEKVRGVDVLLLGYLIVEQKKDWWKDVFFQSFGQFVEREEYKRILKKNQQGFLPPADEGWCRKSVNLRRLFLHFMAVDTEEVLKFNVEPSHKEARQKLASLLIKSRKRSELITIPVPKSFKIFIDNIYKAVYEEQFDDVYWRNYSGDRNLGGDEVTQKNRFKKMSKQLLDTKDKDLYVTKLKLKRIVEGKCDIKAYKHKKHTSGIIIEIFFGYLQRKLEFVSEDGGKHWRQHQSLLH